MFTKKPANKNVKEGASVTFEATVKGKPLPEVTWFKAEEKIESSERVSVTCTEVKHQLELSLTLDKCVMDDAGEIRVSAVNPAGEDSCVAELKIKSKLRQLTGTRFDTSTNARTHARTHVGIHINARAHIRTHTYKGRALTQWHAYCHCNYNN